MTTPLELTDRPYPPRFRWMKRAFVAAGVLAIVLAGARMWWGFAAHRRLQRELDEVAGRGEPITVEQLLPPPMSDDENAVTLWLQAEAAVNPNVETPAQSNLVYQSFPPWSEEWHHTLETGVAGNTQALTLARQARAQTKVDWKLNLSTPLSNVLLPSLNGARNLANVIGDAAVHAHLHGDDFEAIERIADLRRVSHDVAEPSFVSYLVGIGINAMATNRIQMIAPDLRIEPKSGEKPPGAATRAQLRAMIDQLLQESEDHSRIQAALRFERVEIIDSTRFYTRNALLTSPMFDMEMLRTSQMLSAVIRASNEPSCPAMRRLAAKIPAPAPYLPAYLTSPLGTTAPNPRTGRAAPSRMSRIVTSRMAFSYANFLETDWRICLELRFAAVSLATQMYRADHQQWPASLDALVPEYLARVPRDPYSDSGRPMGYLIARKALPDGRDRPLIYSVYQSGDEDLDVKYASPTPQFEWNQSAQFRDLERWSPPPPATEPSE